MGPNKHSDSIWKAILLLATAATALPGCGDGRPILVPISGRVLIDGKPVEHGFIRVHPQDYRPASGALEAGGRFRLSTYAPGDGCVEGKHAVTINALEVIDANSQRWHAPKNYQETSTSGLTIEVNGPADDIEIELTWAGGKPFIETESGAIR